MSDLFEPRTFTAKTPDQWPTEWLISALREIPDDCPGVSQYERRILEAAAERLIALSTNNRATLLEANILARFEGVDE